MKSELEPITKYLPDFIKSLGDGSKKYRGIETGIEPLDKLTNGLSGMVLLSGLSGIGKTSMATQIATSTILTNRDTCNVPVLFYSLEMSTRDLITSFLQNCAHQLGYSLTSDQITNSSDAEGKVEESYNLFKEKVAPSLYIVTEAPKAIVGPNTIRSMLSDVEEIKSTHNCDDVLVVIDSIQDIVDTTHANQTQAEVQCCNDLTILIASTGCTVLAIGQKNKGSTKSYDHYGDTMGSVAFIHKSNNVLLLNSLKEVAQKKGLLPAKNSALSSLAKYTDKTKKSPLELRQIKGRFAGSGHIPVVFHLDKGYFDWVLDPNASDILGK